MSAPAGPLEVDPAEAIRLLRLRWPRLAVGTILGAAVALLVLVLAPAQFDGRALVLIRTPQDASSVLRQRLGPLSEIAPAALGLGTKQDLETEIGLLQSRAVLGRVVDSLRLQVRPIAPSRVAPLSLVDSVRLPGRFRPRSVTLTAGRNALPEGEVWTAAKASGDVQVRLFDREDAIDEMADALDVRAQGGEVVRIRYRGRDSVSAAAVPNLATDIYLARRRTTDRGLNQRRLEFLMAKADSVTGDLRRAAHDLRETQDVQRLFDAEPAARALFERVAAIETQLAGLRSEQAALDSVLARAARTGFDARLVAGVPSLLKSPAVNELVAQLDRVEERRATLLVQLADGAPAVVAAAGVADSLRAQFVPLARTFGESLGRQRASLERDLASAYARIDALPGQSETVALRTAALKRLATLDAGMGAQLLEARLAALSEGGDVRLVDAAVPPRKVAFPRPSWTLAIGTALGLGFGVAAALLGAARRPEP